MNQSNKKSHGKIIAIIIVLLLLIGAAVGAAVFLGGESEQTPSTTTDTTGTTISPDTSDPTGSTTTTPGSTSTPDTTPDATPDTTPGGDTTDVPHEHAYTSNVTPPTCTEKGFTTHTCSCGDSYVDSQVDALGHSWDNGVVEKEATETEEGVRKYTCSTCQETKTEAIPNQNHVHEYTATVTNPTCTEKGYTTHTCRCGDTYTDSETNPTGHSMGIWSLITEPQCEATGVETRTCSICGKQETRSISATGHSYGSWKVTKAAGCVTAGIETKTCSKCSGTQTRSIEPAGHSYGSWTTTKKATCDTNGTQSRTCSKCSKVETKSIAATGHKWDSGKITVQPTDCDDIGVKTYTCTVCSTTKTERINGSHSYGEWQWEEYEWEETIYSPMGNPYPSPMQYRGHRQVRSCTKCSYKDYKTSEKHSHYGYYKPSDWNRGWQIHGDFDYSILVEGTCVTKKKTQRVCTTCGYTIIEEAKDFDPHDFTSIDKDVKASACTFEFSVWKNVCKICGHVNYGASTPWYDDERSLINYKMRYHFYDYGPKWSTFFTDYGREMLFNNPYGWTVEDHVVDSEGYLVQYTLHAHDPHTGKCIKRVTTEQEIYNLVMNSYYDDIYKEKWAQGKAYIYINYALEEDEYGNKWLRPYIHQLVA